MSHPAQPVTKPKVVYPPYHVVVEITITATAQDTFFSDITETGKLVLNVDSVDTVHRISQRWHRLANELKTEHPAEAPDVF